MLYTVIKIENLKPNYYPDFPNNFYGDTIYYDIHRYLLSKKSNITNPIYPDYITDINNNDNISIENEKRYLEI